ncbi:hypothetical protein PCA01_35810 [Pseudoalteromonas carrageenovora]|nr:hypothetical protein PCA01_35810 [Pseudoalteromonas carrageenovora]
MLNIIEAPKYIANEAGTFCQLKGVFFKNQIKAGNISNDPSALEYSHTNGSQIKNGKSPALFASIIWVVAFIVLFIKIYAQSNAEAYRV